VELGLKIGWDHSHYMMHQGLASRSLLRLDMFVFQLLWLWIGNRDGVYYTWSMLLWTLMNNMAWIPQYKQRLFVCRCYFSCFVRGLNLDLSIFMRLFFGKVAEGLVGIASGNFFCVVDGEKFLCVVDVSSWRLSRF
jgi:hypothetical protein